MAENVRGQNSEGFNDRSQSTGNQQRSNVSNHSKPSSGRKGMSAGTTGSTGGRGASRQSLPPKKNITGSDYDGQLSDE